MNRCRGRWNLVSGHRDKATALGLGLLAMLPPVGLAASLTPVEQPNSVDKHSPNFASSSTTWVNTTLANTTSNDTVANRRLFDWQQLKKDLKIDSKSGFMTTNGIPLPVELLQREGSSESIIQQLAQQCAERCFVSPWSTEFSQGYLVLPNLDRADFGHLNQNNVTSKLRAGYTVSSVVIGKETLTLASNIGQTMDVANLGAASTVIAQGHTIEDPDLQMVLSDTSVQSTFNTNFNDFESRTITSVTEHSVAATTSQLSLALQELGYISFDRTIPTDSSLHQVGNTRQVFQRDDRILTLDILADGPGKSKVVVNQVSQKPVD